MRLDKGSRPFRNFIRTRAFAPLVIFAVFASALADEMPAVSPSPAPAVTYSPVNSEFWNKVDGLLGSGKAASVFRLEASGKSAAENDEWRLALARALIVTGQRFHAQYLLTQLAAKSIGTTQGLEALRILNELAKGGDVDESLLEDLALELDTRVDDVESRSMIGYFRARALMRKNYEKWAESSLADVKDGSTWSEEILSDRARQALLEGDSTLSFEQFSQIANSPAARLPTARLARLAVTRLIFERRDFKSAIAGYLLVDVPTRERARSLNELAWSYYYERNYGKALGAIQALKSAYFNVLFSPETHVLEMLIYRELCNYRRVTELAKEFANRYKPIFTTIESRQNLEAVPQFLQMILQEGAMQRRALVIQETRSERRVIVKQNWFDEDLHRFLISFGEKRERIIDAEISRMLATRVDGLASWFLDLRDQVWFLEYEAAMRAIQFNDRSFARAIAPHKPPTTSLLGAERFFWPIGGEAWRDEIYDYEVLVHDECGEGGKAGGGK